MFVTSSIARTLIATTGAVLLAATCLIGAVAPAAARDTSNSEVRTQEVSYSDLNLDSPKGRARLDARIRAAAKAVCTLNTTSFIARNAETRCAKQAIATATRS
jgi:UrcA family protein